MKKINILTIIILLFSMFSCKAQIYPLRTYTEIPENSYLKDTNNELQYYEGTWKGTWENKTIYVTLKKITNKYDDIFKYYRDYLIAKFKVTSQDGLLLFSDNTNINDIDAYIQGGKFRKITDRYSFNYLNPELCLRTGTVYINFTDATKTHLEWKFIDNTDGLSKDCPYNANNPFPELLPNNIILTKQ